VELYYIRDFRTQEHGCIFNVQLNGNMPTGRIVSQAVRSKMSKIMTGRIVYETTRQLISASHTGKKLSLTHRKAIFDSSPKRHAIICIDTGMVFPSIREAARKMKLDHRGIARCCTGEYGQYRGYKFKEVPVEWKK